jgi:dipeptide/tripeptide permease
MGLSVSNASIQTSLFSGTAYITPLVGAWLADGYWGRFKTILVFSMIYAVVRGHLRPSSMLNQSCCKSSKGQYLAYR